MHDEKLPNEADIQPAMLWVDIETPGLDPHEPWSAILEATFLTTDALGNEIAHYTVIPKFPKNFLDYMCEHMDSYCLNMHQKSGLLDDLRSLQTEPVEQFDIENVRGTEADWMATIASLAHYRAVDALGDAFSSVLDIGPDDHKLEMAGASVHFDRSWMQVHWPRIERGFHYRDFDVSTIRKAVELLRPDLKGREPEKMSVHRTLADIRDAITLYKWAQDEFFRKQGG